MSKFTAKPYVETILGEVSGENKAKLLNFINGKTANGSDAVSYTLCKTVAEMAALTAGVHAVAYRFSPTITWKGYFIRTTNHKAFITFKNGIDLWLASIYEVNSDLVPMEKVTADNIRALLREDAYIDVSELPAVPSEETIKGYAVESVEAAESGTLAAVLGLDEDGDLIKGTVSGGGTKLYKHSILVDSSVAWQSIDLITTYPTPLTEKGITNRNFVMCQMHTYGPGTDAIKSNFIVSFNPSASGDNTIEFVTSDGVGKNFAKDKFTDTVTEL